MIKITSADGTHQYSNGTPITKWCPKRCNWTVLPEYSKEVIEWGKSDGVTSNFPAGYTKEEYERHNPNWRSNPDISVTWIFNDLESLVKTFGEREWWLDHNTKFPYSVTRSWKYFPIDEFPNLQSIIDQKRFIRYCKWHIHADEMHVRHNDERRVLKTNEEIKELFKLQPDGERIEKD